MVADGYAYTGIPASISPLYKGPLIPPTKPETEEKADGKDPLLASVDEEIANGEEKKEGYEKDIKAAEQTRDDAYKAKAAAEKYQTQAQWQVSIFNKKIEAAEWQIHLAENNAKFNPDKKSFYENSIMQYRSEISLNQTSLTGANETFKLATTNLDAAETNVFNARCNVNFAVGNFLSNNTSLEGAYLRKGQIVQRNSIYNYYQDKNPS